MNNNAVFVDVDTQFDFMDPQGTIYVPGAEGIIGNIRKLFQYAKENNIKIVSSMDAHTVDDAEFQNFPPHCIKGAPGSKKVEGTMCKDSIVFENRKYDIRQAEVNHDQIILEKQSHDMFDNTNTDKVLVQMDMSDYVVFGVATDYCVKIAALGLLRRGYKVTLVTDAVKAATQEGEAEALKEMKDAGAIFITTEEIITR